MLLSSMIMRPASRIGGRSTRICGSLNHAIGNIPAKLTTKTSFSSSMAVDDNDQDLAIDPVYAPEPIPTEGEWAGCKRSFMAPIQISVRGKDILHSPLFNKGTAFKSGERDRLRIRGLLPHRIMNIHAQKKRFLAALRELDSNIRKNIMLEDLHDRNETLYHRVLVDHIEEMAPYVYTPTVGQACQEYASRFRRPRGMYFSEEDRGHMAASTFIRLQISLNFCQIMGYEFVIQ